ncbi:MAG: hypothetical protein QM500_01570, partial [Methylococcales bacterium]
VINNEVKEGRSNHNISDVWVYINDVYQGNYEVPVKFPVLNTGDCKVTFRAGIKTNGIAATREEYPFYQYIDIDTVLNEGAVLNIEPKFSYITNASFWIEDFNTADIKIGTTTQLETDTTIQQTIDENNPGEYYGAIYVNSERPTFRASTNRETDPISYSDAERRLFLEMQYKNNQYFFVGLITDNDFYEIMAISPSSEWNTIYIDLTPTIKLNYADFYSLAFWTSYDGEKQGEVFLNNIKLVNYE